MFNTSTANAKGPTNQGDYTYVKKDIASGGEAFISVVKDNQSGETVAYKRFRQPSDAIFTTDEDRRYCVLKLRELATKLRAFPHNLPDQLVKPTRIQVTSQGWLVGYTMPYLQNGIPLSVYISREGREQHKLSMKEVTRIFLELHDLITELHTKDVVIGDVRPDNILIQDSKPHVIDADSIQFGSFKCKVFSQEWVDPRLCTKQGDMLMREHSPDKGSDWFAFASMLFQAFTGIGPYDGTARTATGLISEGTRRIQGISVFHQGVRLPPFALKHEYLQHELAQYFGQIFGDPNFREPPSRELLKSLHWRICKETQHEYSSKHCPCGKCGTLSDLLGLNSVFESLSMPARIGIAGVSLAGALIGFRFITHKDERQAADIAASARFFSSNDSTLSSATIDPKLPPSSAPQSTGRSDNQTKVLDEKPKATSRAVSDTKPNLLTVDLGSSPSSDQSTESTESTVSGQTSPQHKADILSLPVLSTSDSPQRVASTASTNRAAPIALTSFNYTPQNSVDVSKIHLGWGQQSFHGGNAPVWLGSHPAAALRLPELGARQRISEGVLVQAVSIGIDAMRKANQGSFPAGSSFTLVVLHSGTAGQREEKQFPIPVALIPAEKELSYEKVVRAAQAMHDICQYFQDKLVVHIAPHGTTHLSSAFTLPESPQAPVRVYILREP